MENITIDISKKEISIEVAKKEIVIEMQNKQGPAGPSPNNSIVDILIGTINGTNTNFSLLHIPLKLQLYLNGMRQKESEDYTLVNNIVTFITAPVPGDILLSDYTY